jgi:hypothetical protein
VEGLFMNKNAAPQDVGVALSLGPGLKGAECPDIGMLIQESG